jgi:hypothetical protein
MSGFGDCRKSKEKQKQIELAMRTRYIKNPKSLVAEAVDDVQANSGFGILGP